MTTTAKTAYTQEQTTDMIATYMAAPTSETVGALALKFDKTVKSIVAKLSREGVYKSKAKATGTGSRGDRKQELMIALELAVGKEMKSLKGLTIVDLEAMVDFMKREGNTTS